MSKPVIRILLIHDDPAEIAVVRECLAEAGADWFRLETAPSLPRAREMMTESEINIVLIDLTMPEGTGFAAFKGLRQSYPKLAMLALSGKHDTSLALQMMRGGAQDYLVKGQVRGLALKRAVRNAIERQQVITEIEETSQRSKSELERQSTLDGLTGLYNKRHARERVMQEMFRADRYNLELCLLMIDIDNFTKVNDEEGVAAGDQVMITAAELIKHKSRATDIPCRYDSDSFLIILPETGSRGAEVFAQRLRSAFHDERFFGHENHEFHVTCSLGLAVYDRQIIDAGEFIRRAEEAVQEAKQAGRNRVVTYRIRVEF